MNTSSATDDLLIRVRTRCVTLPEVTEGLTHGAPTWFVRDRRSFVKFIDPAEHRFDETHVAIWAAAPPGAKNELVAAAPDRFFLPPFGGHDWVAMRLDLTPDGPDWDEVREIITDAYRTIAPTRVPQLMAGSGHTPRYRPRSEGRGRSGTAKSTGHTFERCSIL